MPFKSKAQAKYLFENNPEIAKEFAKQTPNASELPEQVQKQSEQSLPPDRHVAAMKNLLGEGK